VAGEYFGLLPHHHLLSASAMTHELPYILVTLASFWLVLLASAWMGSSIMKHNRVIRDELVARQRELVKADEAKMEFFRFVTHEIKSPVNTAQSAVQAAVEITREDLPAAARDMLDRAVGRLELATDIVKGLADLTRGGLLPSDGLHACDLTELLELVVGRYTETAASSGQRIELSVPPAPVEVISNRGMLEKVLTNLVSNAVRYNRDGGVVTVTLEERGEEVRLTVADEGIGIAPADRERIFEEFYRTDEARQRSNLGTGLGLAIVKRYLDRLGGEIGLISTPGEGTNFLVTLPRHAGTPTTPHRTEQGGRR
jgi:two-component system phosphate regulon sensor histidine kinase PhoR